MNFNFDLNLDGQVNLSEPDTSVLYDLLIVGGGPAGLNAALYAKRKGMEVGIITRQIGGQVLNTSSVDNYLGKDNSTGEGLVNDFKEHIANLNIPVLEYADVEEIVPNADNTNDSKYHQVRTADGNMYNARTLLVATGTHHRMLGVPGEERLAGRGVSYCAICDAPLYKSKKVIIAGGGNSAVEAAIDLAKIADQVILVHRSLFRADQILVDELSNHENITIHLQTSIKSIEGENFMTHIIAYDKTKDYEFEIEGDGIFAEIGNEANNQLVKEFLELNESGEIVVDEVGATSIEGIYAAGDVTITRYKQIIVATADGAKSALAANEYVNVQKALEKRKEDLYENVK